MIKREWLTRGTALLICAASMFSLLAGCNSEDNIIPASSAPVEVENVVPDRGMADRSDLMYLDSIERYKKTDWTANWIWTEGCAEDSYVAFRKTFTLDQAVPSATAFISAVDKYVLWVNGELVVLDYKTDRVQSAKDLKEKYHAQLEYYAEALELLLGKRVKEKIIYSFTLKQEIKF